MVVVVVKAMPPVVTPDEEAGASSPAPLERTANILPSLVRMYTPLGVLITRIFWPDAILPGVVSPDGVVVLVPGRIMSATMRKEVKDQYGYSRVVNHVFKHSNNEKKYSTCMIFAAIELLTKLYTYQKQREKKQKV